MNFKLFLFGFLLLKVSESNLLMTPRFDFPLMPPRSNYYQIHFGFYPMWWFETTVAYVPFCYPAIPQVREEQFLFLENNGIEVSQEFRVQRLHYRVYLTLTVHFRMPFYNTSGKVNLCIRNETVLTLTFEPIIRNEIMIRRGFILIRTNLSTLYIRTRDFEVPALEHEWRNGYQLQFLEINSMTAEEKARFLIINSPNTGKPRKEPLKRTGRNIFQPKTPY